jgi:predicted nuclease of restriction endonuclease-like (RecB) superfamily
LEHWQAYSRRRKQNGKERANYGQALLNELSKRLTKEFGQGFDASNLRNIRQFYIAFPIRDALRHELSWTHYRLLMRVEKDYARQFYVEEAIAGNWSTRSLERQINTLYYERMLASGNENRSLVKAEADTKTETTQPRDIIKDPYVLEFLELNPNRKFYEKELEQSLIDKLQDFLLELGKGFSFVKRQYRISSETGKHFYADLVFYNYILKCFLIIDLKTDELTYQDIGQMDLYVRYFEENVKQENDNPTIGLILCTEKDQTIVKYSLLKESKQVFASKYKTYLPTEEELRIELERERQQIEMEKMLADTTPKKIKK